MALRELLEGKTADERARLKARWFSELPTRTFTRGAFEVTLSNFSYSDKTFSVDVVVVRNGQEVLREDFHFINPPILVDDGTTRDVEITDMNGVVRTITVKNFREDIVGAFKQSLISAIKTRL